MQRECSDHEGSVREEFRCEGGVNNALKLQGMNGGSTETVVEVSRKPSDCDGIVKEALMLQG